MLAHAFQVVIPYILFPNTQFILSSWEAVAENAPLVYGIEILCGAFDILDVPIKAYFAFHDDKIASQLIWMYPVKHISHLLISVNHFSCSSSALWIYPVKHISIYSFQSIILAGIGALAVPSEAYVAFS
jgi:hypothetical protein